MNERVRCCAVEGRALQASDAFWLRGLPKERHHIVRVNCSTGKHPPEVQNAQTLLDFTSIARPNWNEVHGRAQPFKLSTRNQLNTQLHSSSRSIQIGKGDY